MAKAAQVERGSLTPGVASTGPAFDPAEAPIAPLGEKPFAGFDVPPSARGWRPRPDQTGRPARQRLELRGATPTLTGMQFDPVLPFEDWQALGIRISISANATAWWLGDWLSYGQYKYGRRYKAAIAGTGLDYQTLRNYAMVARRFQMSRRRDKLSFQHHAEVCALKDEEQDEWLGRAERERWSRNELRRNLRVARYGATAASLTDVTVVIRFSAAPDRAARWEAAAAEAREVLEVWMLHALDTAADTFLDTPATVTSRGIELAVASAEQRSTKAAQLRR